MREIKFRAWDNWDKKMVYQNDDHFVTNVLGNISYEFYEEGGGGIDWKDKENISLMQFTGLKDKNGKDIYEGDIIKAHPNPEDELHTYLEIGFVEYNAPLFQMIGKGYYGGKWISNMVFAPMEIIGNIYENPELVK